MKISKPQVAQFKLVTGENVIAQVTEHDENSFIVDFALTIEDLDDYEYENLDVVEGKVYYVMKPFIAYTDDLSTTCSINPIAIVALSTPPESVINQYINSCQTIQEALGNGDNAPYHANLNNVVSFRPKD
jgi:uncharacterized protein YkvS